MEAQLPCKYSLTEYHDGMRPYVKGIKATYFVQHQVRSKMASRCKLITCNANYPPR